MKKKIDELNKPADEPEMTTREKIEVLNKLGPVLDRLSEVLTAIEKENAEKRNK